MKSPKDYQPECGNVADQIARDMKRMFNGPSNAIAADSDATIPQPVDDVKARTGSNKRRQVMKFY